MYPLFDSRTMSALAEETRRNAAAARLALCARSAQGDSDTRVHGVRRALGMGLVRAGLRLIEA
jgi:hypothetical protein